MIKLFGNKVSALAVALTIGSVASIHVTSAVAGPRTSNESQYVSFADLDLTRSADRAALKRRINDAAENVCLFQGYVDIACRDEASADALNQVQRMTTQHFGSSIAAATVIVSR